MEKQTKIYLGLAAAGVFAYLILKPKKAAGQTAVVAQNTKKVCPEGKELKLVDMTCIVAPCPSSISMCVPIRKVK